MKAVCVLKGQGPVEGTIHFVQKARAGAEASGEAVPAHLCPGAAAGGPAGRPRHAPAARGLRVRAARGFCPAAVWRPSAESPGGPGGGGGAWRGLGGGAGKEPGLTLAGRWVGGSSESGPGGEGGGWLARGPGPPPRRL